jgi:hypothetical protein
MITFGKPASWWAKLEQQREPIKTRHGNRFSSSHARILCAKIVDEIASVAWSSGYPATHMLLSHIGRRTAWAKNTIIPLLCIAATIEIAEEFL